MGGQDPSTTWVPFTFFLNTKASKSLCYGPGLLDEIVIGHPVEFVIQARNEKSENRNSGRDNFEVKIVKIIENQVPEKDEEGNELPLPPPEEIPCSVEDRVDGSYVVTYTQ